MAGDMCWCTIDCFIVLDAVPRLSLASCVSNLVAPAAARHPPGAEAIHRGTSYCSISVPTAGAVEITCQDLAVTLAARKHRLAAKKKVRLTKSLLYICCVPLPGLQGDCRLFLAPPPNL